MAVSNFTLKLSGTVAYTDNSHGSFEASATFAGNLGDIVAQHSSTDSQTHFSQLFADKSVNINSMLSELPGSVTLSPSTVTPDKTVSSFVMEISGVVAHDDNTKGVFVVQFVNEVVNLFPVDSTSAWAALAGDSSANSFLTTVFEAVAGTGNVTITS